MEEHLRKGQDVGQFDAAVHRIASVTPALQLLPEAVMKGSYWLSGLRSGWYTPMYGTPSSGPARSRTRGDDRNGGLMHHSTWCDTVWAGLRKFEYVGGI